jgi:signal transduction histidine kinase
MLMAICKDIRQAQTPTKQQQKSHGLAPRLDARETAAQTHAFLRARGGFNINHMVSEYRALRASVLRLWADASNPEDRDAEDTIRFNEAIDQALAESTLSFSQEVDQARNLLLGALGHDMRNPLNAIRLTAQYLHNLNASKEVSVAAQHLIRSGSRMKTLLDDLTDFNRTRLGLGIAVYPTIIDLAKVFEDELQVLKSAHPGLEVLLDKSGDLTGAWDGERLHQVLGNLVQNALHYGAADKAIKVVLCGSEGEVTFRV